MRLYPKTLVTAWRLAGMAEMSVGRSRYIVKGLIDGKHAYYLETRAGNTLIETSTYFNLTDLRAAL